MNKQIILLFVLILVGILVSSFVSANLNSGLVAYYNFNQTGNLTDQVFGIMNSSTDTVESKTATGINNNAWEFVAVNDDKVDMMPTNLGSMGGANPRTINAWVKIDDASSYDAVFSYGASGIGEEMTAAFRTDNILSLWGSSADSPDISFTTVGGVWYMFTAIYNGTYGFLYVNGTNMWNGSLTWNTATTSFVIGDRITNPGDSTNYDGVIDEMGMWNRTLTDNELLELYNNGVGKFPPFVEEEETSPPTIVNPSPADNAHNNTNVTLNVSHSTAQNDIGYYLYFGTSSTLTEADLYLNNVTRNASEWRSFYTNVSDGTYYWKWKVQNITDGVFSSNTTQRTWILDTAIPTITLISNNGFKADNSTIISNYFNNLTINISFFDINLYQTLVNITNSTDDSVYNYTNVSITQTTDNITGIIDISGWTLGNYTIQLAATDSHTLQSIRDYGLKLYTKGIEYATTEGIKIKIETLENILDINTFSTQKYKDKYSFKFKFDKKMNTVRFRLTSSERLIYLPDSEYKAHFITLNGLKGNWIDFDGLGLNKKDYQIEKVNDFIYDITISGINQKDFEFRSLGGLNLIEEHYRFEIISVVNISVFDPILNISLNFTSVFNGITKHSGAGESNSTQYINISKGLYTLTINISDYNTLVTQLDITDSYHNFTINMYKTNVIDDCTLYSEKIITFIGKNEEVSGEVNMSLDIMIKYTSPDNISIINNVSFIFRDAFNYSICTNTNQTFFLDSIMEYGDGTTYTDRKYYLNNLSVNTGSPSEVFLYHLNNSKASEIVFTVFDKTTGDRINGAFIKILRYYPGGNVLRVVEIAKTDEVGQTLGKMVLADVFYKFIIEKPAGTVRLDTGVLRILSLTRSFGISFIEDVLDTWDKIQGVSTSVTCTKGTQTCRLTWSDSSNIVRDAKLEVWRTTGLADALLSTQTTTAAAGTISYTIVEDTDGMAYTAKGFIESNTGTSLYGVGIAGLIFSGNPFFTDPAHRAASLFPLFLLVVVIVFALIDFGVIGIVIGSLLGMILGSIIGILPIDPFYLISFILMAAILIYKLSK